ncbi:MAG TPA: F0F1 ATP synthase subunit epsilon [Candidatus Omnitrophota bacterium]|nr:F0F1 ATP synthase subunit epsilon [Candidatus Omnitrophota bacterium]
MDKVFTVSLKVPGKTLFEGEAVSLVVPAYTGRMGILANHAPLAAELLPGEINVRTKNQPFIFHSSGKGFMHVIKNRASIILEDKT